MNITESEAYYVQYIEPIVNKIIDAIKDEDFGKGDVISALLITGSNELRKIPPFIGQAVEVALIAVELSEVTDSARKAKAETKTPE